jgi:hypothetical protein
MTLILQEKDKKKLLKELEKKFVELKKSSKKNLTNKSSIQNKNT